MKFSLALSALLASFLTTDVTGTSPPNDECPSALNLPWGGSAFGSTVGAGTDSVEGCGVSVNAGGVWYTFNSNCGGRTVFQMGAAEASTCSDSTNFDTQISLYMGSCDELMCVGSNDQAGMECANENHSILDIETMPNTVYYVLVHGWSGTAGDFELSLTHEAGGVCGGDPHIRTWRNEWYDFHGECDLVFLHAPGFGLGLGLTIHIRTTKRYEYSFIESAALQIGDDVLELSSWGDYVLNGISSAEMPAVLGEQYPVTYTRISKKEVKLVVQLSKRESIILSSFKDLVHVEVENGSHTSFGDSVGLMGDFAEGKLLGRDGVTVFDDHNAFGNEWQVLATEPKLFNNHGRLPQHPQKCNMPDPNAAAERRRRLGEAVPKEDAEAACGHHEGDQFDLCIYDVMATGDIEVAEAGWL